MSRYFNGTITDYLNAASVTPISAYPFTLAGWGLPTSDSGQGVAIIGIGSSVSTAYGIYLNISSNLAGDPVNFGIVDNGTYKGGSTTNGANYGSWNHICGVAVSATERYSYLNGDIANKGTTTESAAFPINQNRLTIGALYRSAISQQWLGNIAHVSGWNVALSDDEVYQLSQGANPLSIRPQSLVFYFPYLGRQTSDIDIINKYAMTASGTTSSADEPRIRVPGTRGNKIYTPWRRERLNSNRARSFSNVGLNSPNYDYLETTNIPVSAYPLTFMCWWRTNQIVDHSGFITLGRTDTANRYVSLAYSGDVGNTVDMGTRGTTNYKASSDAVTDALWHHAVGVVPADGTIHIYSDNVKTTYTGTTAAFPSGGPLSLRISGRNYVTTNWLGMNGALMYPAIWDVALTDEEVASLYYGETPLNVRTSSLKFFIPEIGRDINPIDIISGSTLTRHGEYLTEIGPPVKAPVKRKSYIPIPYTQGSSRYFNGNTDYMYWDGAWDIALPFSVSCWVKVTESGVFSNTIWLTGKSSTINDVYALEAQSVGGTFLSFTAASRTTTWAQATSTETYNFNEWIHIAAIFRSTISRRIIVNGVESVTNTTSNVPTAGRNQFTVGAARRSTLTEFFKGNIAHFALWNGEIDATTGHIALLAQGQDPRRIDPELLLLYLPTMGRDSSDIDIVGGKVFTNVGAAASDDTPRITKAVGRRNPIYVPPQYSNGNSKAFSGYEYLSFSSPVVNTLPITISAWVNPSAGMGAEGAGTTYNIMTITDTATQNNQTTLELDGGYASLAVRMGSGTSFRAVTTVAPTQGAWNHICGVHTSDVLRAIYLNGGNKITGVTDSGTFTGNYDVTYIGTQHRTAGLTDFMHGCIAEPAVWNVALTDNEVASLAAGADPRTIRPANLVSYIPFMGRDVDPIDIIGGRTFTNNLGAAANDGGPSINRLVARTSYIPPIYGGSSLSFVGNDSYLECAPPVTAVPLTMSIWVKNVGPGPYAAVNDQAVMSLGYSLASPSYNHQISIEISNVNGANAYKPYGAYRASSGNNVVSTVAVTQDGKWNHIAATFTSATARSIFVNNTKTSSTASVATPPTIDKFRIGKYCSGDWPLTGDIFQGEMAHAAIWNVALTDAEVLELSQGASPLMVRPNALVFYAPLTGEAATERDIIGGRTLKNYGAAPIDAPSPINFRKRMRTWLSTTLAAYNKFFMFMR